MAEPCFEPINTYTVTHKGEMERGVDIHVMKHLIHPAEPRWTYCGLKQVEIPAQDSITERHSECTCSYCLQEIDARKQTQTKK